MHTCSRPWLNSRVDRRSFLMRSSLRCHDEGTAEVVRHPCNTCRVRPSTTAPSHLETVQALHGFLVLLRVCVWLIRLRVHSFAVVCVLLDPGTRSSQSVYLCTTPNALARRAMPPTLRPYTATYPLPQLKVAGDSIVDRSHHFYLRYPCALVPFVLGVRHVADGLHRERRRRTH